MTINNFLRSLIILAIFSSIQVHAGGAVIVHPSNGDVLDTDTISKIFLGKKRSFPSGVGVILIDLAPGSATRSAFVSGVLNKSESQMKAYWAKLMFTGKGTPPKEVPTDADVIALVAKNPSVIGYVDASSVDDSVKVVQEF